MNLIDSFRNKARQRNTTIVFPEGSDKRILKAAEFLKKNNLVTPILLGREQDINDAVLQNGVDITGIKVIDPETNADNSKFAGQIYELRKHKGLTEEEAKELVHNSLFQAAFLVKNGFANGAVGGAINTTGDVMRAAIQVIGLAEGIKVVSSCFLMVLQDGRILTYGDCAVIPDPDAEQLSSIAISTSETHLKLTGELPAVAMLSFSTKGSAKHERAQKVQTATALTKEKRPNLKIDGELQFDAALIDEIGKKKAPGSEVAGKANVFIFPDLDAGNIGYKITERLGNAQAIGPVIQGLAHPFNDLSRGCNVEDVINVACICALLA